MVKKRLDKFIRIALVALFLSYYSAFTLFPHTHITDGGTITHSHPYLPSSHHTHSASSLALIDVLSHIVFVVGMASFVGVVYFSKHVIYIAHCARITVRSSRYFNLRAPPIY